MLFGLIVIALVLGGWRWLTRPRPPTTTATGTGAAAISAAEARAILGVSAAADTAAVRDAHRRRIAEVHPDRGGSAELARRVNAARDVLLHGR